MSKAVIQDLLQDIERQEEREMYDTLFEDPQVFESHVALFAEELASEPAVQEHLKAVQEGLKKGMH
mgnify:CR=1 FL=1